MGLIEKKKFENLEKSEFIRCIPRKSSQGQGSSQNESLRGRSGMKGVEYA